MRSHTSVAAATVRSMYDSSFHIGKKIDNSWEDRSGGMRVSKDNAVRSRPDGERRTGPRDGGAPTPATSGAVPSRSPHGAGGACGPAHGRLAGGDGDRVGVRPRRFRRRLEDQPRAGAEHVVARAVGRTAAAVR